MDKNDVWKLGANCTDVDCKKAIPNSGNLRIISFRSFVLIEFRIFKDCFAGLCKCKAGYGPSADQRKCKKSKRFGSSCHPISDQCFMDKLWCDPNTMICQCAPGYR